MLFLKNYVTYLFIGKQTNQVACGSARFDSFNNRADLKLELWARLLNELSLTLKARLICIESTR